MKYAIGFFGGRVLMVNPHPLTTSRDSPMGVVICEGELYEGKGWAYLYAHRGTHVMDYSENFDFVMREKYMVNRPWKIYGDKK